MPSSTKQNRMKGRITNKGRSDWQDASSGCHMWRIDNFSGLTQDYYHCSDVFMIGGCKWYTLFQTLDFEESVRWRVKLGVTVYPSYLLLNG